LSFYWPQDFLEEPQLLLC